MFDFLPELNWQPQNWQSRAVTNRIKLVLHRLGCFESPGSKLGLSVECAGGVHEVGKNDLFFHSFFLSLCLSFFQRPRFKSLGCRLNARLTVALMNFLSSFLGWRRPNLINSFESLWGVMGCLFVFLCVISCPSCHKLAQLTLSLLWNSHRNSFEIEAFSTQTMQPQFCCCCCLFVRETLNPRA